jgi:thiamine biosynthesis lipoprotein
MKGFHFSLLVSLVVIAFSCQAPPKKVAFQGQAQGTYYAVTYFDSKERNLQVQIDSILRAFDMSVSIWKPESIISKVNRGDSSAKADAWFREIFSLSVDVARKTDGAFDFTIGPLVNAWGFGFKGKMKMDSTLVDSLRQLVDYTKVRLEGDKVYKENENMQFDFNAIAQGYAVDVLGAFLETRGINNYLVDIGGEVLGKGSKPDGQAWLVGIENPAADSLSERSVNTRIRLENKAVATSGNYRKYYEKDGLRYSHTIDPENGYPVRHNLLSVSVLADDCASADAYATAFMVMGFEKAREFIENQSELEAFFIMDGGSGIYQTYATKGFEAVME